MGQQKRIEHPKPRSVHTEAHSREEPRLIAKALNHCTKLQVLASDLNQLLAGRYTREPSLVYTLSSIRKIRQNRSQYFPNDLFADPAWDILLYLKEAEFESRNVSVNELCAAAAVPATTALRWIDLLANEGLLKRQDDPFDRRRVFISLESAASETMHKLLTEASRLL